MRRGNDLVVKEMPDMSVVKSWFCVVYLIKWINAPSNKTVPLAYTKSKTLVKSVTLQWPTEQAPCKGKENFILIPY